MKKQKNSCRSVRYQFKGNCIIVWCDDAEQYRITLDEDNILVKLIHRRTGEVHHYPADNPYTQMCLDIVRASKNER